MALEFDAQQYRRASGHQRQWGQRLMGELALAGHEQVLDLGCGDGTLTAELARRVPQGQVVGVDISANMIAAAKGVARPNQSFRQLNLNELDYDGQFDVVYSNATLQWIHDHDRLLSALRRALKSGGRLFLSFGGKGNCARLIESLRTVMARPEMARWFAEFTWPWRFPAEQEYREMVEQAGFADCEVWIENADKAFPSAQEILAWMDQPCVVPFRTHLAEPRGRAFRDAVAQELLDRTRRADGTYFETFRRLNVRAKKP